MLLQRKGDSVSQKTWGGRFSGQTDNRVEAFTESISFDQRLYRQDIQGSKAHAKMLAQVGLLTAEEVGKIVQVLDEIEERIDKGDFTYSMGLEDIHTHIERALIEQLGDIGRKLHTARSRNDQIVTDVKLWVREAIDRIDHLLSLLQKAYVEFASREGQVILPGYTHLQRAQPVLAGHYFLAYVEKLQRDRDRLRDCRARVNVLPLGSAALAGTSLPINRELVCQELGFDRVAANSLDVSSDRDFLVEYVFDLAMISLHLSTWAEEWILWTTTEFNFLILPDAFCTGSSIMPHKKNPDVLELIRGRTSRTTAALNQLLMLLKGLPLAYNRDLQEDKLPLFAAHDNVEACLELAAALVSETHLNQESISARLESGYLDATTLMEFFIRKGVPMRAAHEAVGKLVRKCEEKKCRLGELQAEEYDAIQKDLSKEVGQVLGVDNALRAFCSYGSTAPDEVQKQLEYWQKELA